MTELTPEETKKWVAAAIKALPEDKWGWRHNPERMVSPVFPIGDQDYLYVKVMGPRWHPMVYVVGTKMQGSYQAWSFSKIARLYRSRQKEHAADSLERKRRVLISLEHLRSKRKILQRPPYRRG